MTTDKISYLKQILHNSKYTVALCGSGMLKESGLYSLKSPEFSYEIEERYGVSPEYIYSSAYFNTRPEQFYNFLKKEMLSLNPAPSPSFYAMAALERAGILNCIITANVFGLSEMAGCTNIINLHNTIYSYVCPHCKREYDKTYVLNAPKVPKCETCGYTIRPKLLLFGEMLDGQTVTRTATQIEQADTLLVLGTKLESDVFRHYVNYFKGSNLILIHREPHFSDHRADLVFLDDPKNILPLLVD